MTMLEDFLQKYPVEFTERELEVLRHVIDGSTDKQIASRMGMDSIWVRVRIKAIERKLGVNNRTKVAVWGWMWGYNRT